MKIRLLGAAVAAVFTLIGSAAHADDLADIRKKGEIVIGTLGTDEPNSFIDPKTRQIIGYEVDLGTEIAKAIGVKPVFKQISVAARIPELQQGHVDLLAASLTHNKEREALVDFSYSIIVTGQKALVKKNAGFASLHDLDGKKVLTVKGGTQEPNIRKALPNAQVVTFETSQQALLALQQGKGQAFVDDESALVNDFGKLGAAAGGYASCTSSGTGRAPSPTSASATSRSIPTGSPSERLTSLRDGDHARRRPSPVSPRGQRAPFPCSSSISPCCCAASTMRCWSPACCCR